VNAILNYAYAILAGQVELALQIAGLDVAVKSLYADQDGRILESLRPVSIKPFSVEWRCSDGDGQVL